MTILTVLRDRRQQELVVDDRRDVNRVHEAAALDDAQRAFFRDHPAPARLFFKIEAIVRGKARTKNPAGW